MALTLMQRVAWLQFVFLNALKSIFMRYFLVAIGLFLISSGCGTSRYQPSRSTNSQKEDSKQYLKDFALCSCLYQANKDSILRRDLSYGVLQSLISDSYSDSAIDTINSAVGKFVENIKPAQIDDFNGSKANFMACMDFYRSKQLKEIIKSLQRAK